MIKLKEIIVELNDRFTDLVANRTLNPENDPQKKFEVKLWLEIHGQTYDGGSNYKKCYYDKLTSDDEKIKVKS